MSAAPESTELAVRNPAQELVLRVRTPQFRDQVKLALPETVSADRFTRVAITALQQNPDIADCDVDSIFSSLLRAAADGLLPDGREAALVSFNTKDKTTDQWVKKAQYMPMIGGFRKIAAEHGWTLRTDVVYANDEFDYELGETPRLHHRPARLDQERGDPIGAYAVGTHRDGRRQVEVLSKADIEKVRQVSKAKDRGPWVDWYDRMAEKTAGRRLFAKLPLGEREADRVVRVIEASELEPGAAAQLLYGPAAGETFVAREIEAAPSDSGGAGAQQPADADTTATSPDGGSATDAPPEQNSEAAVGSPAVSGAGHTTQADPERAASENDDDDPPPPAAQDDELAQAGEQVYPKRSVRGREDLRFAGKTIAEVEATAPEFNDWVLELKPERWQPEFRYAVALVVGNRPKAAA